MTKLSFKTHPMDMGLAKQIADRAVSMEVVHGGRPREKMDWWMDIIAVHVNGNPLRLNDLLQADDFNFAHDVFGICRHLDRSTGQLTDHFSPRFSAQTDEQAQGVTA